MSATSTSTSTSPSHFFFTSTSTPNNADLMKDASSPKRGFLRRLFGSSNGIKMASSTSGTSISHMGGYEDAPSVPRQSSDYQGPKLTIKESATQTNLSSTVHAPSISMPDVGSNDLLPSALDPKNPRQASVDDDLVRSTSAKRTGRQNLSTSTVHSSEVQSVLSSAASSNPTSASSLVMNKRTTSLQQDPRDCDVVYTEPRVVTIAQQIYNGTALFIPQDEYACWLGTEDQGQVLKIYMSLFEFQGLNILTALRLLCDKIYMRGESQQLHRIIEAFSQAWSDKNPTHGFYDMNVVYTIAYSLLLLNTDLYAADHTSLKKMSKPKFAHNTLHTIYSQRDVSDAAGPTGRYSPVGPKKSLEEMNGVSVVLNTDAMDSLVSNPNLVPFSKEWEREVDTILRAFYTSLAKDALKLNFVEDNGNSSMSTLHSNQQGSTVENSASSFGHIVSKTASIPYSQSGFSPTVSFSTNNGPSAVVDVNFNNRPHGSTSSGIFGRMNLGMLRGSPKTYEHESRIGQSSLDRYDTRNNSIRSTFSGETSFSAFGVNRQAVGFAGLLWNSMIKEEESIKLTEDDGEEPFGDFDKIQQELANEEELELLGAPWAKEGIILYRPYIDPNTGKKNRKKDWLQVFMVVQRGQLKMFKFDTSSGSSGGGGAVGGGNWMERANLVDGFHLCHTMAQEAPASKKIKGYNGVWSLTLPQRGLLVFRTGTPEIAREFVYTCNYWAARLSKEPFDESVSSMEFGWGIQLDNLQPEISNSGNSGTRGKRPGDRLAIRDWKPNGQSLVVSDLNEDLQLKNLEEYVDRAEEELAEHNGLQGKIVQSFSTNSPNLAKAQSNWERKSQYLLQQVIRYKVYADSLKQAVKDRAKNMKKER